MPPMTRSRLVLFVLAGDLIWIQLAVLLSLYLRLSLPLGPPGHFSAVMVLSLGASSAVTWTLLYLVLHLDCLRDGSDPLRTAARLFDASVLLLFFEIAFFFGSRLLAQSRLELLYFAILLPFGLTTLRLGVRQWLRRNPPRGLVRRIVIAGNDAAADEIAQRLRQHPFYEVVGIVGSGPAVFAAHADAASISSLDLLARLRALGIHELIASLPENASTDWLRLLTQARQLGIEVRVLPRFYQLYAARTELTEVAGMPLISVTEPRLSATARLVKRLTDLILVTAAAPLWAPLTLVSAGVIRLRTGQAFTSELRCGRDGQTFPMFRLNLSRQDASPLGVWFNRLSLTELPQFWNIFRGDMSLVGPRPEPTSRVQHYSEWERRRLLVKPGLTGLAQVHGLRDDHASAEKSRYDLIYFSGWTPWQDWVILVFTTFAVLRRLRPGASAAPQTSVPESAKAARAGVASAER